MSLSPLLDNPTDIYATIKSHFPDAYPLSVSSGGTHTTLYLSERVNPLTLSCAFKREPFIQELQRIAHIVTQHLSTEPVSGEKHALDTSRFSTPVPLKGTHKFYRDTYEQCLSYQCSEIIIQYLENLQNEGLQEVIRSMGLAPSQVKEQLSEDELIHFRKVFRSLNEMTEERRNHVVVALRNEYPLAFQFLVKDLVAAGQQSERLPIRGILDSVWERFASLSLPQFSNSHPSPSLQLTAPSKPTSSLSIASNGVQVITFSHQNEACKHLNLPEGCQDRKRIEEAATSITQAYRVRQQKVPPYFAQQLEVAILNVNHARDFLLRSLPATV